MELDIVHGSLCNLCALVACVASVSVGFGSKERPSNGNFGVLPARKMGREPKNERGGWGNSNSEFRIRKAAGRLPWRSGNGYRLHARDPGSIPRGVACQKVLFTLFYFF